MQHLVVTMRSGLSCAMLLILFAAASACTRETIVCGACPACGMTATPTPAPEESDAVQDKAAPAGASAEPPAAESESESASAKAHVPAAAKPPEAEEPLPNGKVRNVGEYFATLKHRFQPAASKDLHAVFQFDLSGADPSHYHVEVDDGAMKMERGHAAKADVTIAASEDDYVKIVNGEMGGLGAVMGNKMKVGGNIGLAQRMNNIFPPAHK